MIGDDSNPPFESLKNKNKKSILNEISSKSHDLEEKKKKRKKETKMIPNYTSFYTYRIFTNTHILPY